MAYPEAREPGSRRKKLAGYWKAANELRQSYFTAEDQQGGHESTEGPGAFPDAAVVRSGNEEMILFPSYGRNHTASKLQAAVGSNESEQEYWRKAWEQHQNENAIVDVDVRGWIYTPHRGQQTRKQRLLIGMARQLSGLPAPPATRHSEGGYGTSQASSRTMSPSREKQEEEIILREAESIIRRGQQEEKFARRGEFSEDHRSSYGDRDTSPERQAFEPNRLAHANTMSSIDSGDTSSITPLQKRSSWNQPSRMSAAEITVANAHLLNRLKPFMHNPLANTPISAFFYSDTASRQHTVYTDASGHFTCRAALDFIPTHVRVLAGEKLSATEEIHITYPKGVSLISDIDDTIKHSAISAGAREIFRNAFLRDLGDLTIDGTREWYTTLHDMGVKIHYVSNSPWQMYPVLTSFFKKAKLPAGSFHLKQYTGMLQGIFEPVAERKKGSLDKIMRDFPERKFILVGDSGEADLEVYTDVALDNPGRILGIFIRDVTTPVKTGYFDSTPPSGGGSGKRPLSSRRHSRNNSWEGPGTSLSMSKRISRPKDLRHPSSDDADLKAAIAASLEDMEVETRQARRSINPDQWNLGSLDGTVEQTHFQPGLRESERQAVQNAKSKTSSEPEEDLIDFNEQPEPAASKAVHLTLPKNGNKVVNGKPPSPSPPPKPKSLRSPSPNPPTASFTAPRTNGFASKSPPPPRPRKPSSAVNPQLQSSHHPLPQQITATAVTAAQPPKPSPLSQVQVTRQDPSINDRPPLPARPRTYRGFAKEKITNAYNAFGGGSGDSSVPNSPRSTASSKSFEGLQFDSLGPAALGKTPPPPPPRRAMTGTLPFSTSRRASFNRLSGGSGWGGDEDSIGDSLPSSPGEAGMSKKEWMWRQRWARSREVLESNGVTLRSWRVGSDVADVCVRLAEGWIREAEAEAGGKGTGG